MADWLLLRMPRAADVTAEWLLCDSQGLALGMARVGVLAEAAMEASGRKVCAIVPSTDVLYTQVELPAKAGTRALQMARYALEEQILGDVESQHFALGRRTRGDARVPVAVTAREHMEHWLAALHAAGIQPDLLCAESALLPPPTLQPVALLDGDALTLVPQLGSTVCLPAADPAAALTAVFGDLHGNAVDLQVCTTAASWQQYGPAIEALRPQLANLRVQLLAGGVLPWLAPQLVALPPLNLLQGDFQPRQSGASAWPRWRLAAALAGVLLLLHVGDRVYTLWGLRQAEATTDAALLQLGEQALPGVVVSPTNLRQQVQQQLAEAATHDSGALLGALQSLAHALTPADGGKLHAANYHDGSTELQLRAKDAQTVERVKQALRSDGMNAELVGGGAAGGVYEGRIQIKSGPATGQPAGGQPSAVQRGKS